MLLLDEPTRGVDVGAKFDIYTLIRALSAMGTTVIITSSDLPELIGMCDRILIMRGGAQHEIVQTAGLDSATLLAKFYDWGRPQMITFFKRYGTLLGYVAIILFFWFNLPDTFMTARNWFNISQQISMLAVIAFTMTIVVVMGYFELSVGSMASLSGITAALKFTNGFLVSLVGILPFVATLGTLTMYSGIAFLVSDGKTIFGRDIPKGFSSIARSGIELESLGLKIPFLSILALVVLFVVQFTLEHTPFGRRLYASGGNNEAARLAGVKVRQLRATAFALTGLGAAIGGLMLHAIAAVFLGMTISEEGEPRVLATLVGVLMLGLLDNGLTQMSVDSFVREILVGAIILAAVASSSIGKQRG